MVPGVSLGMRTVLKQVRLVAPTTMTVVLLGESGVGKEVIARLIHQFSPRQNRPFVPVNCAAIPDALAESLLFGHVKGAFTGADKTQQGAFEQAHEGTLFLDEVALTSEAVQMKLLRVLQEKQVQHLGGRRAITVNVRIIAASNVGLKQAVGEGKLRADLYYRLNEFTVTIPPLRERRDDILPLAHHFLKEADGELGKSIEEFSSAAAELLTVAPWHGNVRELKNVIRRATLLAENGVITPDELSIDIGEPDRLVVPAALAYSSTTAVTMPAMTKAVSEAIEKDAVAQALRAAAGNKAKAARMLGIDRSTLYAKLNKNGGV